MLFDYQAAYPKHRSERSIAHVREKMGLLFVLALPFDIIQGVAHGLRPSMR